MIDYNLLVKEFKKHDGVMKTSELNTFGLNSRNLRGLLEEDKIVKIKKGVYQLANDVDTQDAVIIGKLFPSAIIYLQSALLYYGYTDRIPFTWQIAVDKDSSKSQYKIDYPAVTPFYLKREILEVGVSEYSIGNIRIKIYDRDRTICDILRYEKKIDKEIFNKAVQAYIKDDKKNISKLLEYAKVLRVINKVKIYVGVWL
jgi:predicted transcriptional regulator of viral defense system